MDYSCNSKFLQFTSIIYFYEIRKAKQSKFSEECDDYIFDWSQQEDDAVIIKLTNYLVLPTQGLLVRSPSPLEILG